MLSVELLKTLGEMFFNLAYLYQSVALHDDKSIILGGNDCILR